MTYSPDSVELKISTSDQARLFIESKTPKFTCLFNQWQSWINHPSRISKLNTLTTDILLISYARMSLRNGSASSKPRQYHNEMHIEELLSRLIYLSEHSDSDSIPNYGCSLLTIFVAAHDLRQNESGSTGSLVGKNEAASFQELNRLISVLDTTHLLTEQQLELLELMIQGSTFGSNKDENGHVFNGNLVQYLFNQNPVFDKADKELAFLACDIDTANVSEKITEYAESSVNVFEEILSFSNTPMSAQLFFGELQENYFFTLQKYNSKCAQLLLEPKKQINAPIIKLISEKIQTKKNHISDNEIIRSYINYSNQYK